VKREQRELIKMLNLAAWDELELTVAFASPDALGRIDRWLSQMN
jgi:hypothetical protein